ncbi:hypothetical protein SUGI_0392730 [Cryptomeria japonica]|nr:hypothetical protein SUGI_0392730 [Cryptomeria japonica]
MKLHSSIVGEGCSFHPARILKTDRKGCRLAGRKKPFPHHPAALGGACKGSRGVSGRGVGRLPPPPCKREGWLRKTPGRSVGRKLTSARMGTL